ncbi:MAG: rRNA pseudouridine synthase [Ignavibacteriales bacterium]|nr:MAG: rRNA pseudouridine synthase [Ignavibacteriales bacterium]
MYQEINSSVFSLPKALLKLGNYSRGESDDLIQQGKVTVNQKVVKETNTRVNLITDVIKVDGHTVEHKDKVYIMLNKPSGVITTASDDIRRETVYDYLKDDRMPWVVPVGKLDKASEGLIFLTNDYKWAEKLAAAEPKLEKTYHMKINLVPDEEMIEKMKTGVKTDSGEVISFKEVKINKAADKFSWVEFVIIEGKDKQIRRLLSALNLNAFRLIKAAIGPVRIGELQKGRYRRLNEVEMEALKDLISS